MVERIRKVALWALVVTVAAAGVALATYYSGVTIPFRRDLTLVAFPNWNKTATIEAEIDHDSRFVRHGRRVHFLVDLQMPGAAGRLQAFLDGGRTEVVACGPQKLFMHSLTNGDVAIDGDLVRVRGAVNMEFAGPVKLRGDWPTSSTIRVGHDRTSVWARIVSLDIANVPEPMIAALLQGNSRFVYTREQILDMLARSMKPAEAEILAAHRDSLDVAFESVRPALRGGTLVLDAVVSVDETAALKVIGARLFASAAESADALANLLEPSQARAQLKLDDVRKRLENTGKKVLQDVTEGKDPNGLMETIWKGLPDCKVSF